MSIKKSNAIKQLEKINKGPISFGKMIESLRKSDSISQVDLADKLKISRAMLCDIEKGRRKVSLSKAKEFAKAMGYSPAQFAAQVLEDLAREAGFEAKITLAAA